jgi:predicted transcriptional regulator
MSLQLTGVGLHTALVSALKAYNRKLPIGFLASRLNRRRSQIIEEIECLEHEGVVMREGDEVRLLEPECQAT